MTRIEALRDLLTKVEAGKMGDYAHEFLPCVRAWRSPLEYFEITNHVHRAYHGSLDAAKALHEAVLPDWTYLVGMTTAALSPPKGDRVLGLCASDDNSARAWLIAVLKALIAKEPK
jgi:hypothetical protein